MRGCGGCGRGRACVGVCVVEGVVFFFELLVSFLNKSF